MTEPASSEAEQPTQSTISVTNVSGSIDVAADQVATGANLVVDGNTIQTDIFIEHLMVMAAQSGPARNNL